MEHECHLHFVKFLIIFALDCTVAEYAIQSKDELQLVRKSQSLKPQSGTALIYQANEKNEVGAPKWRLADPGLCFEGVCNKADCVAYLQKVIMKMGYGNFDMIKIDNDCKCPMCHNAVEPQTCGFSKCWWRWYGTQQESKSAPLKHFTSEWMCAGDAYYYYDEQTSGSVNWHQLILEVSKSSP